jgi:hypothetical protein
MEQVTHYYSDDLTGEVSEDVKTYPIGWLGTYGEVDLNEANFQKYNTLFQELLSVARPIPVTAQNGNAPQHRSNKSGKTDREKRNYAKKVREWAWSQGLEVERFGRVPKEIVEAYENRKSNGTS